MYAMKVVGSSVFRTMSSPHNRKNVTIDQLTHYETRASPSLDNVLSFIGSQQELFSTLTKVGLGIFKHSSLLVRILGDPLVVIVTFVVPICVVTTSSSE